MADTFPASPTVPNYGIQDVLTINNKVYILQGSSPQDQEKAFSWSDQYDSKIGQRQIDIESTATISAIGEAVTPVTGQSCRFPLSVGASLTYRTLRWLIKSIAEAGTYNGLTVWTISLERSKNYPITTTVMPDIPVSAAVALPVAPASNPA